jgi:clan AA aspartic protease (TIGR02281 family)
MRVSATVNDHVNVPFFIDTGASGVSLPAATARRLGIIIGPDTQRVTVRTANGTIRVPLVRLDSVVIGTARVEGLMATLNPTTDVGLLGGAFFNNFKYQVDPATSIITLKPSHSAPPSMSEGYWRGRFGKIQVGLDELDAYLQKYGEALKDYRREELEQRRTSLRADLDKLQLEANRDNVPRAWRR